MSRFICGQVGETYWPHECLHGKAQEGMDIGDWCHMRDEINKLMDRVHAIGWKQSPRTHYGVGYNANSDACFDMYQVIRHELWKADDMPGKANYTVDASPAMKFGKEPLITVKPVE